MATPVVAAPPPAAESAPARPAPAAPPRIRRAQIGFNVLLQLLCVLGLVIMANFLAFRHFKRLDYSRDRKFTLSERTRQFLGGLSKPVKLIVFMAGNAPLRADAADLATEYRQVQPKFITVEQVNPYTDIARATELQTRYKVGKEDNVVIVDYEGRQKLVDQDTMADFDRSGEMFGQAPQITAFKGEQALTGALLEVVEAKKNVLYYLRGQAQPELGPRGPIAALQETLERENISFKDLNLANAESVPADAGALLLAGAKYDLSEREVKVLEDFWNAKQGRLFLLLNPDASAPRLLGFLARIGIRADDNRITFIRAIGTTPDGTQLLQRAGGVLGELAGETSPVVKSLKGVNFLLPGATNSLSLEPDRVRAANIRLEPLLRAQKGFWGEADYRQGVEENPAAGRFDAGRDKADNLVFAASAERGVVAEGRVGVGTARVVVVANARFIENEALTPDMADFFRNALNWLLDRDRLIGIPPKEVKTFNLNVPDRQVFTLFVLTTFVIPAAAGLLGLLVWWRRRA